MNTRWLARRIRYDGSQLAAHWILRTTGLAGDAIVGFRGACAVAPDRIADLADVDGPGIAGDDMVHLLWESFDAPDLARAVLRQRLLAARAAELLRELGLDRVRRDGDDLYVGAGKLSISVAAPTAVSALIHFAVNVTRDGVPVRAAALADRRIDPARFGRELLRRTAAEEESMRLARAKVRIRGEHA
jgi:hypothetical protein